MKRYLIMAALAVAALSSGANQASADYLDFSIQINGLDLVNGSTTGAFDSLSFLKINNTVVADARAVATNLTPGAGAHQLDLFDSSNTLLASFTFPSIVSTTQPNSFPVNTVRSTLGGMATVFMVMPSFYGGETLTTAVLSITAPVVRSSAVYTGNFGGSIDVYAVPEPASMAMLAMGGMGVLGAARRRRKV